MPNKEDFSIVFWIDIKQNPGWRDRDSEINFPPFVTKGIKVYFSKIGTKLKVYLLHPEIGYRKLVADISKYLNGSTHVVLTNSEKETILYLNAEQASVCIKGKKIFPLEVNDYVMLEVKKNEIDGLSIKGDVSVIVPAKIKKMNGDKYQFLVFGYDSKVQVLELEINRIKS